MTAMNTARKKGTRRELAAFIPATTMIKLAKIKSEGTLSVPFTLPFIQHPFTFLVFPFLPREVSDLFVFLILFRGPPVLWFFDLFWGRRYGLSGSSPGATRFGRGAGGAG